MRVFVSGGNGFIGRHLVGHLVENDFEVTVFDDLSNSKAKSGPVDPSRRINFVRGDIRDLGSLQESMRDHDVVVHLAAKISVAGSKGERESAAAATADVNVNGSLNVLRSCGSCNVSRLIAMSSAAVYGEGSRNRSHEETDEANPVSAYGKSKLRMEKDIVEFAKTASFDSVIFRLFNVYGEGQSDEYAGVIKRFLGSGLGGRPVTIFGDGEQTRDFIHVSDVIQYISAAITDREREKWGVQVYNIATGSGVSINQLAGTIFAAVGGEPAINRSDPRDGDIVFSAGNAAKARKRFNRSPKIKLDEWIREFVFEKRPRQAL